MLLLKGEETGGRRRIDTALAGETVEIDPKLQEYSQDALEPARLLLRLSTTFLERPRRLPVGAILRTQE